ncbi:MAG: signal recognition particle protein [Nitrospinaceae bacterium]|jgi:signal recognition particle subunit SRP54|nr:signal recognition particle protein [Nitrospinaceae bacterium]MBT3821297.1 signal recognition particle protein [Nitrospinaceae bacterium]MBT4094661.1 signal recognition particle protein [Nitrospinaceae bacterium]MBT5366929.1 signal recognition particle protein [Nitrospinaceae bacterium]MBT5948897.1 signal recognition particle protein [Nitrospinaceae bacterium]
MFEGLRDRLSGIFKDLRSRGVLGEQEVDAALREIRLALLEADVNFKVAKDFIAKIRVDLIGVAQAAHIDPSQQVVKAVQASLVDLMGGRGATLERTASGTTVVMFVGLQGSGKTTSAGKLALRLKKQGLRILLVPADVARPAAILQLKRLAEQTETDAFDSEGMSDPVAIVEAALARAKSEHYDYCIVDTAGRMHVDDELMDELRRMKKAASPHEILLVADAMTGQEAVNLGEAFGEAVGLTGVVLTKMDGDARGGAAVSLRAVTGVPIKLVGVGEKLDALEEFHPERMASRILGMGDVLSLIEKAEAAFEPEAAQEMAANLQKGAFTLEMLRDQMKQMSKLGSMSDVLSMVPGLGAKLKGAEVDEREVTRTVAIIDSMTKEERRRPAIIKGSRRKRIAAGSGTEVMHVNRVLKQFTQMQKMMRGFSKGGKRNQMKMMQQMLNQ